MRTGVARVLFDKIWAQIKGAERTGTLTVEERSEEHTSELQSR